MINAYSQTDITSCLAGCSEVKGNEPQWLIDLCCGVQTALSGGVTPYNPNPPPNPCGDGKCDTAEQCGSAPNSCPADCSPGDSVKVCILQGNQNTGDVEQNIIEGTLDANCIRQWKKIQSCSQDSSGNYIGSCGHCSYYSGYDCSKVDTNQFENYPGYGIPLKVSIKSGVNEPEPIYCTNGYPDFCDLSPISYKCLAKYIDNQVHQDVIKVSKDSKCSNDKYTLVEDCSKGGKGDCGYCSTASYSCSDVLQDPTGNDFSIGKVLGSQASKMDCHTLPDNSKSSWPGNDYNSAFPPINPNGAGVSGKAFGFDGQHSLTSGTNKFGGTHKAVTFFFNPVGRRNNAGLLKLGSSTGSGAADISFGNYLGNNYIGGANVVGYGFENDQNLNSWTAIAIDDGKLFVNGRTEGDSVGYSSSTSDPNGNQQYLTIGGAGLIGYIDEVKIYNDAIPPGEVINEAAKVVNVSFGADPILYYSFDNSLSDSSANPAATAISKTPVYSTGIKNNALNFDGTKYLLLGQSGLPPEKLGFKNSYEDFITINVWVKTTSNATMGIIKRGNYGSDIIQQVYTLYLDNGHPAIAVGDNVTFIKDSAMSTDFGATTDIKDGKWHMITALIDRNNANGIESLNLYIDSRPADKFKNSIVYQGTGELKFYPKSQELLQLVGALKTSAGFFKGDMDELKIWNRKLSDDEMSYLYYNFLPMDLSTKLVGYYKFDGNLLDSSGKGKNLTQLYVPSGSVGSEKPNAASILKMLGISNIATGNIVSNEITGMATTSTCPDKTFSCINGQSVTNPACSTKCEGSGSTAKCVSGGTGNICGANSECTATSHNECQLIDGLFQCVPESGPGKNQCTDNNNCQVICSTNGKVEPTGQCTCKECESNADCPAELPKCNNGKCNPECKSGSECGAGKYCKSGKCVAAVTCGANQKRDDKSNTCICEKGYIKDNGNCRLPKNLDTGAPIDPQDLGQSSSCSSSCIEGQKKVTITNSDGTTQTICKPANEHTMNPSGGCKDPGAELAIVGILYKCQCGGGASISADGKCGCPTGQTLSKDGVCVCTNGLSVDTGCCPVPIKPICSIKYDIKVSFDCQPPVVCMHGNSLCDCKPKTQAEICQSTPTSTDCVSKTCSYISSFLSSGTFTQNYPFPPGNLGSTTSQAAGGIMSDGCGKFVSCSSSCSSTGGSAPAQYSCDSDDDGNEVIKKKEFYYGSDGGQKSSESIYQYGEPCKKCIAASDPSSIPTWGDASEGEECDVGSLSDCGYCGTCEYDDDENIQCVAKKCECTEGYSCVWVPTPNCEKTYDENGNPITNYDWDKKQGVLHRTVGQPKLNDDGTCNYKYTLDECKDCQSCDGSGSGQCSSSNSGTNDEENDYLEPDFDHPETFPRIADSDSALKCDSSNTNGNSCTNPTGFTDEAKKELAYNNPSSPSSSAGDNGFSPGRSSSVGEFSDTCSGSDSTSTSSTASLSPFAKVLNFLTGKTITGNSVIQYSAISDDTYISSKNNLGISGNSNFTISFWVYPRYNPEDNLGFGASVLSFGANLAKQGVYVYYDSNKKTFQAGVVGNNINVPGIYPENNWYHFIETYDGNYISLYIDNIKVSQTAINLLNLKNTNLFIGVDAYGQNRYFNGSIGELKIWNYPLPESEISADYNLGDAFPSLYLQFDGNTNDYSGYMNDGNIINSASFIYGKIKKSINLSGNQYVNLSATENLKLENEITISALIKPSACNGGAIIKRGLDKAGNNYLEYLLTVGMNALVFEIGNSTGGYSKLSVSYNACNNVWNYVTAVLRKNNAVEIWINGTLLGATKRTFNGNFEKFNNTIIEYVGAIENNNVAGKYQGLIDELKVWKYGLSPEEIQNEYKNIISSNKLVLYYPFDDYYYGYLNESNNITKDYSGYNDGVLNRVSHAFGKIMNAYDFSSENNSSISSSNIIPIAGKSPWSVSAWVYPKKSARTGGIIGSGLISPRNESFYIRYNSPSKAFEFGFSNSILKRTIGYPEENWYHIVETYDGTNIKIYINNALIYSNKIQLTFLRSRLFIGGGMNLPISSFNGTIDEVKLWSYALNEKEISQEYARGFDGLSLYLPFDGDSYDYSGLGNNAVLESSIGTSYIFNNGIKGKAIYLPISYSKIVINNSSNLDLGNEMTIFAWILLASPPNRNNTIIKRGIINSNDNKDQEYVLYAETGADGKATINFNIGNSITSVRAGTLTNKINLGFWNHVAVILRKNNAIEIYINGALKGIGTRAVSGIVNSDGVLIGQKSILTGKEDYFKGYIDELKVWKYALSASEISEEYKNGNKDIKIYYKFNGDSNDYSGNINDGVLQNANVSTTLGSQKPSFFGASKNIAWLRK